MFDRNSCERDERNHDDCDDDRANNLPGCWDGRCDDAARVRGFGRRTGALRAAGVELVPARAARGLLGPRLVDRACGVRRFVGRGCARRGGTVPYTRGGTRPWPPCRLARLTRSGRAGECAGPPDAWLLRPRGVRELHDVHGLLEARAGAVLPRGRRLRGAAPRPRPRPGELPLAGAVARRGLRVDPAALLPEESRVLLLVRGRRGPGELGSARNAARAPRPGGAGRSRRWAAGSARSETGAACLGIEPVVARVVVACAGAGAAGAGAFCAGAVRVGIGAETGACGAAAGAGTAAWRPVEVSDRTAPDTAGACSPVVSGCRRRTRVGADTG